MDVAFISPLLPVGMSLLGISFAPFLRLANSCILFRLFCAVLLFALLTVLVYVSLYVRPFPHLPPRPLSNKPTTMKSPLFESRRCLAEKLRSYGLKRKTLRLG